MHRIIAVFLCLCSLVGVAQKPNARDIQFDVQPDPTGKALLTWSITNKSNLAIFVYDLYLWGPTAWVERNGNRVVLSTTPSVEEATCPPNRFPPVLLLLVGPGRTIRGEFVDRELKIPSKSDLSMRIAVGDNPFTVVDEAKRFANSNCKHSPYDAIVRWGTIIDSNSVQVP